MSFAFFVGGYFTAEVKKSNAFYIHLVGGNFIIRTGVLIFVIGLISCGKHEKSNVAITDSLVSSDTGDFYSISKFYGDYENDHLLIHDHMKETIGLFKSTGREILGKQYGEGDCHGKVRRFVLNSDTLAIDKHNCGEHGFGNTIFLIRGDSLKTIITYLIHRQNQIEPWTDVLEIAEFRKNELIIGTSTRTISDWGNLKLNEPPEHTQRLLEMYASSEYEYYYNKYKGVYH